MLLKELIALWGEPAMRGLQRDKECEIAIRCRVVEAEIEKKMQSFLKIYKISEEKNTGESYTFFGQ